MKTIKILIVLLSAIGIAGLGLSCGSSSSGNSSGGGGDVSGALSSLPNANLTTQNVGNAAGQALGSASQRPPTDPSNIVNGGGMSSLSYFLNKFQDNLVIKPESMRGAAQKTLTILKGLAVTGSCAPTSITGNYKSMPFNFTMTWNNVPCDDGMGDPDTLNGSISLSGSYDQAAGTMSVNFSINLTESVTYTAANGGGSAQATMKGSESVNGTGITTDTSSVTYTDKGSYSLSGNVQGVQGSCNDTVSGSYDGWKVMDDSFSGNVSQLSYGVKDGTEENISGTSSIGGAMNMKDGAYANASMALDLVSDTQHSVNGSGTFGAVLTETGTSECGGTQTNSTSYAGKFGTSFSAVTFDASICGGEWPSSGTLTITANHTFGLDFSGDCGCADLTIDNVSQGTVCEQQ